MFMLPTTIFTEAVSNIPLTVREGISGALGYISIACWVFLLVPQVIENYRNKSAEAVSFLFICIWAIGDIANLLGSLWATLIPTTIGIAIWFCIQDTIIITQCLYYNIQNRRMLGKSWLEAARESVSGDMSGEAAEAVARVRQEQGQQVDEAEEDDEEQPLLKRTISVSAGRRERIELPAEIQTLTAAQRRQSMNEAMRGRRTSTANSHIITVFGELQTSRTTAALRNALVLLGVFGIGTLAWYASYRAGVWNPVPLENGNTSPSPRGAQILGYISAVAYLGARIPQILKNYREQSCEGLSLLFFIFSICGNLSQGGSILFHSTERAYVMKNVPWLIGSLGTMAEDITIFTQFHMYGTKGVVDESAVH